MTEENEKISYPLSDEHVEMLSKHAHSLRAFDIMLGQQVRELLKNIIQANTIEENMQILQEDIAKELGVPRANKLSWDLTQKCVEVID